MTTILGIKSSCDETAAAVVIDGKTIASNVIASQIDLHAQYGGVYPEVASRAHVEAIGYVVEQALDDAGIAPRRARRRRGHARTGAGRIAAGRHQLRQGAGAGGG